MDNEPHTNQPVEAAENAAAVSPEKPPTRPGATRLRLFKTNFISIRVKVGGAFAIVLILLILLAGLSIHRLRVMQGEVNQLAAHDILVVQAANKVEQDILNMENQMRGYLVTGNESVLTSGYDQAKKVYPGDLKTLTGLVTDPQSKTDLNTAVPLVQKWVVYADKLINMRNIGQGNQAAMLEVQGTGSAMVSTARADVEKIITRSEASADAASKSLQATVRLTEALIIIVALLAVIVSIVVGVPATFRTPRNISQVRDILEDIASQGGDLRRRITGVKSRDEVELLAESTNRLLDTVAGLVSKVVDTSESVAASAEELTASTDETARTVGGIAETAGDFAAISEQARSALLDMARSLDDVQAQGDNVKSRVDEVVQAVSAAAVRTEEGNQLVAHARDTMGQIEHTAVNARDRLLLLEASSNAIAKISTTIRSIAGQTNLLALNAAIEAARAGEAGRGFAVVAQEVRKLAEQSRKATDEIENIVKENQLLTRQAAESMQSGVDAVATGRKVTQDTSEAFAAIRTSVDAVAPVTQGILESVEEQIGLISAALSSVQSVTEYMEQVAAGSEENAASTQESLATVEEIAASSHALAALAQELQSMVGAFQL